MKKYVLKDYSLQHKAPQVPVDCVLWHVRDALPRRPLVSSDGLSAQVVGSLPELCRLMARIQDGFVREGRSYNMLFLCRDERGYFLRLTCRNEWRMNAMRCGIVDYKMTNQKTTRLKIKN